VGLPSGFTDAQLREAIQDMPNGGILIFPDGAYTLNSNAGAIAIDKEITLTTPDGGTVSLARPDNTVAAFTVGSGGKLNLQPGTGGSLTIKGNSGYGTYGENKPLLQVNGGGEAVINEGVYIQDTQMMGMSAIEVRGSGSTITMTGGTIRNIGNRGPITIQSAGSFNMSGGFIINNNNHNSTTASVIFVTGANSSFTMSGGEISDNASQLGPGHGGGAVRINNGASFTMTAGVIRDNHVILASCLGGGGVYVANSGIFKKTGGIIYGNEPAAELSGDWNRITADGRDGGTTLITGKGAAVYCQYGPKFRDTTSNAGDTLDSSDMVNWNQ
jgi:hypothetical protein